MKKFSQSLLAVTAITCFSTGLVASEPEVYFISPANGETLNGAVTVRFGLRGMGIAPAGVDVANTGHHHLLINMESLPAMDAPMPATSQLKHFGGGQTETVLQLPPGEHTLQLVLGDYLHTPLGPTVISEKISITVE